MITDKIRQSFTTDELDVIHIGLMALYTNLLAVKQSEPESESRQREHIRTTSTILRVMQKIREP